MLAIPVMNDSLTDSTRENYLAELKKAGCDRVFIVFYNPFDDEELREGLKKLNTNLRFFEKNGIEPCVWTNGLGHGGSLSPHLRKAYEPFERIVGLFSERGAEDSVCPLGAFTPAFASFCEAIASVHPKILMIDDDLRLSMHGAADIGCACGLHLKEISARTGRTVTREDLREAFRGERNRLRETWLAVQGDSMRAFAKAVREAVDRADSNVRVGACACLTTYDLDGFDSFELARIFAGGTKPFVRFIGAPYWNTSAGHGVQCLGTIIDMERMQQKWASEAPDVEIFSEGDVYPRPRFVVPAAYLEGFDQALLAAGMPGILKYMLDYSHPLGYEPGYLDRHNLNAPVREDIRRRFTGREEGICLYEPMKRIAAADCSRMGTPLQFDIVRPSLNLCALCGLPTTFDTSGDSPMLLFGDNARICIEKDKALLARPLILDARAAEILTENGMDVGLLRSEHYEAPGFDELFPDGTFFAASPNGLRKLTLSPAAEPLSVYGHRGQTEHGALPSAYRYENADGQRFFVYAFDAEQVDSRLIFSPYARAKQLKEAAAWLEASLPSDPERRRAVPVSLAKCPRLYTFCRRDGKRLTVGFWSFYPDGVLPCEIETPFEIESAESFGTTVRVENGKACLGEIAPFTYARVTLNIR